MKVFAVDDLSIFSGSHSYINQQGQVPHCAKAFLVDGGSGEASGEDSSADIGRKPSAVSHNLRFRWRFDLGALEDSGA